MNREIVMIVNLERETQKSTRDRINELREIGLNEDASIIVALGEKR